MMNTDLALAMIVKNDPRELDSAKTAALSVIEQVSRVYITLTGPEPSIDLPLNEGKITYSYFQWVSDFAAARNFNFAQVKEPWILWLDADDTLLHPEHLPGLLRKAMEYGIDGYWVKYLYEKDADGEVSVWHWKLRIMRNNGHGSWAGRVHEDFLQRRKSSWVKCSDVEVDHHTTGERKIESIARNIAILKEEYEKDPKNPDPRTIFYLATALMQAEDVDAAMELFAQYLTLSGWDEERYEAHLRMAAIHRDRKEYDDARKHYFEAIAERPEFSDAYFEMAYAYQLEGNDAKCVEWSTVGFAKRKQNENVLVLRGMNTWRPIVVYAYSLVQLGKFVEAIDACNQALRIAPNQEYVKEVHGLASALLFNKEALKWYVRMADYLRRNGQTWRIPSLIQSIPINLQDNVITTKLKHDFLPPRRWPDRSVVIFCGLTAEEWSPKSLDRGGIGGSETAVIHLSRQLVKLGWKVTVFNWCGAEEGTYDGVEYRNYWSFRSNDRYDRMIFWRTIEHVDYDIDANQIFVDLHDVPNAAEFTEERLQRITKILVKSEYHRSLLPNVPDDKIVVIPNGIDVDRYVRWSDTPREPNTAIYSSSPNRGLDIILELWPRIKEKVPGAKLRVFYGWKTFYEIEKNNPPQMKWMKRIQERMKDAAKLDVIDMGRVGQKELAEWQMKTDLWFYPTYFPEISCITAMEVQAAGCVPVCTDYAALDETVQHGIKVSGDIYDEKVKEEWLSKAIEAFSTPFDRGGMSRWAMDTYGWVSVAKRWDEVLR